MSDSWWPHELWLTRLLCPSLSPWVCSKSSIQLVMPSKHLILCRPFSSCPHFFPQQQGLFQWVSSSYHVAKLLELQLQYQSFQWIFRTDFISDELVGSPCSPRESQESSSNAVQKHKFFSAHLLYGPTLLSEHDYWKNHSFDYTDLCWQRDVSAF